MMAKPKNQPINGFWEDMVFHGVDVVDNFIDAVYSSNRIFLEYDDAGSIYTMGFILTPGAPIAVSYYVDDVLSAHSELMHLHNWSIVPTIRVPTEATAFDAFRKWFYSNGYVNEEGRSTLIPIWTTYTDVWIMATGSTISSLDAKGLWKLFKPYLQEFYFDTKKKSASRQFASGVDSAWSEQMWPNMVGLRTEYIDNVGVFVPDYCKIDFNLSHAAGTKLVGLEIIRAPNLDIESKGREATEWGAFLSFIIGGEGHAPNLSGETTTTGEPEYSLQRQNGTLQYKEVPGSAPTSQGKNYGAAGGIVQGIKNTLSYFVGIGQRQFSYKRLVYPRLLAFGRQIDPRMSYDEYMAEFKARIGNPDQSFSFGGKTWNYVKKGNLNVVPLSREAYDAFVNPLAEYIDAAVAQNRSGTKMEGIATK